MSVGERFHPKDTMRGAQRCTPAALQQPNEMWLLEFEVCEVSVTVLDVWMKACWTNPLIGGMEKRRVLHQLFNPSAMAKPATDGRCPQRPMDFAVQHKYLEAGC